MAPRKGFKHAGTEEERILRRRAAQKLYRDTHKAQIKAYKQRTYARHKESMKLAVRRHQLKKYGLTIEDYERIFKTQNGVCAICGNPPKKRALAVDHHHKTLIVRGLLCWTCNRTIMGAIDRLKINPMKIVEYMERSHGTGSVYQNVGQVQERRTERESGSGQGR